MQFGDEWISSLVFALKSLTIFSVVYSQLALSGGTLMRIAKEDVPVRIDVPGAVARQKTGFGDATGYGMISGEYFSIGAGTDIAPLLQGLEGDMCQSPHWGYLLQGEVTVTYADGTSELVGSGDLFYWPPGHTVKVDQDAEVILFSPQKEHSEVIEHMRKKIGG